MIIKNSRQNIFPVFDCMCHTYIFGALVLMFHKSQPIIKTKCLKPLWMTFIPLTSVLPKPWGRQSF